jgi:hypothetical protein
LFVKKGYALWITHPIKEMEVLEKYFKKLASNNIYQLTNIRHHTS